MGCLELAGKLLELLLCSQKLDWLFDWLQAFVGWGKEWELRRFVVEHLKLPAVSFLLVMLCVKY